MIKIIDARVIDDVISVNQSQIPDGDNKKFSRQPLRPPLPPLASEVAPYRPYRSLKRVWKKHFTDGLEVSDIPIMRSHARRLVHCNCTWDEDTSSVLSFGVLQVAAKDQPIY